MMRHGGGGSLTGAFAYIAVNYPAGSKCTCTKDGKTLRDWKTEGCVVFPIPEAGTWTVSIEAGGVSPISVDVAITARGQIEKKTLSFTSELFAPGQGADLWSAGSRGVGGTAAVGSEAITLAGGYLGSSNTGSGWAYTTAAVDMSGKDTLKVTATAAMTGGNATPSAAIYLVAAGSDVSDMANAVLPAQAITVDGTEREYTVDVSSLSSSCHVCIQAKGAAWTDGSDTFGGSISASVKSVVLT